MWWPCSPIPVNANSIRKTLVQGVPDVQITLCEGREEGVLDALQLLSDSQSVFKPPSSQGKVNLFSCDALTNHSRLPRSLTYI